MRSPQSIAALALFASGWVAGCGPLVQARLDPVDVCWQMQRVEMPAAPFAIDGKWIGEQQWVLPQELRQPLRGLDPKVELVQVELRAEGVDNLGFIRDARLSARADPAAAPVEMSARRTGDPRRLLFVAEPPVDVTRTLESGALKMAAEISARLPEQPWTMVVNACYRAGGTFEWNP